MPSHHDRILDPAHLGKERAFGHQGGMHAQFKPPNPAPSQCQGLDAIAKGFRVAKILWRNPSEPFAKDLGRCNGHAESEGG